MMSLSLNIAVGQITLLLTALLLVYLPVSAYLNYRKCPQIQGPWLASVSGLWLFVATASGDLNLHVAALFEKYGSPVRIAPNKIVTNDPVILRHMSAPRSNFKKGTWYDSMTTDPTRRNSLSQTDEKRHNALRSSMTRGYSGKEVEGLEDIIDTQILNLLALIRSEASKGHLVDFARLANFFTLDVLTQIAFEAPFGYLTRNEDVYNYITLNHQFLSILELGSNFPKINYLLNSPLMAPLRPRPTDRVGMGALLGVAKRVIEERYGPNGKDLPDLLGSFKRNGLSQSDAEGEAILEVLGGADSTSTALRMTMLYILSNPEVYVKLLRELNDNAASSSSRGQVIPSASARKLPYLQAVIKESLRMWPPLVGLQGKLSPPGGETVNGVFIPGGVEVGWSCQALQRRREIFGENVDVFLPERWLGDDDDAARRIAVMDRTVDLVFGSGRYGCLGKSIAWMELEKTIPSLLLAFELARACPERGIRTICYGTHIQREMWFHARPRKGGEK